MSQVSDKWQEIKNIIKFWVAKFSVRFCGVEVLYWSSPAEWEIYMNDGHTPYVECEDCGNPALLCIDCAAEYFTPVQPNKDG